LRHRASRIFIQCRVDVAEQVVPLTRYALLQFRRPKALAFLDPGLRLLN
jgi:hypothetical protein